MVLGPSYWVVWGAPKHRHTQLSAEREKGGVREEERAQGGKKELENRRSQDGGDNRDGIEEKTDSKQTKKGERGTSHDPTTGHWVQWAKRFTLSRHVMESTREVSFSPHPSKYTTFTASQEHAIQAQHSKGSHFSLQRCYWSFVREICVCV